VLGIDAWYSTLDRNQDLAYILIRRIRIPREDMMKMEIISIIIGSRRGGVIYVGWRHTSSSGLRGWGVQN
jgi:hypothetical protein